MNGRVIKFEGPVHAQADRLLPWYVNGTLDNDERAQVEHHLAECAPCRQEAAWLRAVQEQFVEQADKDEVSPKLRRLHRRVARLHGAPRTSSTWHRREKTLAWLAAVQAAVILGLSVIVLHPQHDSYRTLSAAGSQDALLVVMFDPHTREAQMRELVRSSHARIVGGPTETGAYVLRVPEARSAATRKMLLGSPQVTLVEDLSAGGHP